MKSLLFKAVMLLVPALAFGTDYYVATDGDNTTGDGTMGNPYATVQKALNKADTPGDNVLIRGGRYSGASSVYFGGDETAHITIKPYNNEKVILDGALPLTGWTRCTSAADADGNPNWANIYYCESPSSIPYFNSNIYEGDSLLSIGQTPFPDNPYFDREESGFIDCPTGTDYTATSLTDPAVLTQTEDGYWNGALIYVHTGANAIVVRQVTDYVGATRTLKFSSLGTIHASGDSYSLANHISLINCRGTYYYNQLEKKVFMWPLDTADLENGTIRMSRYSQAFFVSAVPYVRIKGITMEGFMNNVVYARAGSNHFILEDCEITRSMSANHDASVFLHSIQDGLVHNNYIHHNKHNRGIVIQAGSGTVVQYNTLTVNGYTAVDFYDQENSACMYNTVSYNIGVHANGLTFYDGCLDILVMGNCVHHNNIPLTMQASSNITIINNVLSNPGGNAIAMWSGGTPHKCRVLNNTVIGGVYLTPSLTDGEVMNNIIGGYCHEAEISVSHNIYYAPSWCQDPPGDLGTGEFVHNDVASLFIDYDNADYILSSSSAAKDAGTDVSSYYPDDTFPDVDFAIDRRGAVRPTGAGWDIGAYEYTTSEIANDKMQITNTPLPIPNPASWSTVSKLDGVRILELDGREAAYGTNGVFLLQSAEGVRKVLIKK